MGKLLSILIIGLNFMPVFVYNEDVERDYNNRFKA